MLLVVLVMVFTLSACAQQTAETPQESAPAQSEENVAEPTEVSAPAEPVETPKLLIWSNLTADAQQVVLVKQFGEIAEEMGIEIVIEAVPFKDMYTNRITSYNVCYTKLLR